MKGIYKIIVFLFLFISNIQLSAHSLSFVYIQGDKSLPFYVKKDNKMMPRYGKNYCIIPEINKGILKIEILFQQNSLSPINFTINVLENSAIGFLLCKKEGIYCLYDIKNNSYINKDI